MPEAVYRMLTLLGALVVHLPIGTNLGLLHVLWMLVSGRLLTTRGAVIPGLDACGLSRRAGRPPCSPATAACTPSLAPLWRSPVCKTLTRTSIASRA